MVGREKIRKTERELRRGQRRGGKERDPIHRSQILLCIQLSQSELQKQTCHL